MTVPIKFYDLVTRAEEDGVCFSPNTWVTRMCLLHKELPFETIPIDGRGLMDRSETSLFAKLGGQRPVLPLIDNDGTLVSDSWKIAEYLDATFPSRRSLFTPASTSSEVDAGAYETVHALCRMVKAGMGSSDSRWTRAYELAAPGIVRNAPPHFAAYFTSDAKQGSPNYWSKILAMNRGELVGLTRRSFLPLETLLEQDGTEFITSKKFPGIVDYIVFGRYAMVAAVDPNMANATFAADPSGARTYLANEKNVTLPPQDEWDGDVRLDRVQAWIQRVSAVPYWLHQYHSLSDAILNFTSTHKQMLDLHDGHARKVLDRPTIKAPTGQQY